MSQQDEVKNTGSRPGSGDGVRNTGYANKGRSASSGARYGRGGKDKDGREKPVKQDTSTPAASADKPSHLDKPAAAGRSHVTDKPASSERKPRSKYNKQSGKGYTSAQSKGQNTGTAQQSHPRPQNTRQSVKGAQQDSEPHDTGNPPRGVNQPAQRTAQQKARQVQERGGARERDVARERDGQAGRERAVRTHQPGDNVKSSATAATEATVARSHGTYNTGSGRGRRTQSARVQRVKPEETLDDIKADIVRIEKEIGLEIKEIQNLKLAL